MMPRVALGAGDGSEMVVVDALLGTGARGAPSRALADAVRVIQRRRAAGAVVVSLDIPTGIDATTGTTSLAVSADLTISFGTEARPILREAGRRIWPRHRLGQHDEGPWGHPWSRTLGGERLTSASQTSKRDGAVASSCRWRTRHG